MWIAPLRLQRRIRRTIGSKPSEKKGRISEELLRRLRFRRFSTVQLLIALDLLFTTAPLLEDIEGGELILSILFSLVLLAGVVAVANRKRVPVIAIILAIPTIAGRWINHFRPDLIPPPVFLVAGLVLITFVIADLDKGNLVRTTTAASASSLMVARQLFCAATSLPADLRFQNVSKSKPGPARSSPRQAI